MNRTLESPVLEDILEGKLGESWSRGLLVIPDHGILGIFQDFSISTICVVLALNVSKTGTLGDSFGTVLEQFWNKSARGH